MNIVIIGSGPAGLYLATLFKRRYPDDEVVLYEQNATDAMFGFGVVFSEQALKFLWAGDLDLADTVAEQMERWNEIKLVHHDRSSPAIVISRAMVLAEGMR